MRWLVYVRKTQLRDELVTRSVWPNRLEMIDLPCTATRANRTLPLAVIDLGKPALVDANSGRLRNLLASGQPRPWQQFRNAFRIRPGVDRIFATGPLTLVQHVVALVGDVVQAATLAALRLHEPGSNTRESLKVWERPRASRTCHQPGHFR